MKDHLCNTKRKSVVVLFLLICIIIGNVSAVPSDPRGIILISWDGISKDTLQNLLETGSLPHLSSLLKTGSFINISITDHYPDTMAGHAQILTGYSPEQTGVFKSMRYGEIPHGMTVFERLEDAFGSDNISTAIVASQERSLGMLKGLPFYHAGKVVDYYYDRNSDAGLVGSVASESVYHFGSLGRFFIFAHFRDAADAGYAYGAGSPQQIAAILKIDEATGSILQALKDLGISDKTVLYITTDHGFNTGPKDHTGQISLWMVTNEPGYNLTGDQKDITPTILKRFGVSYDEMNPPYNATAMSP
ncbi:alkaline phosphatase family protein [Methanospirillum hungatei]|uniref:alkaline phosphatase family protein n=1 Tax=Methanospirillum hungatei TaxID=2203 RepID=UPI0026EA2376|nr:alkaline phosphatase family protein [Methanospirillum hungatei]MCA1915536.1 alkaline phosphatase family protein [Methanospirillum hungatei]